MVTHFSSRLFVPYNSDCDRSCKSESNPEMGFPNIRWHFAVKQTSSEIREKFHQLSITADVEGWWLLVRWVRGKMQVRMVDALDVVWMEAINNPRLKFIFQLTTRELSRKFR